MVKMKDLKTNVGALCADIEAALDGLECVEEKDILNELYGKYIYEMGSLEEYAHRKKNIYVFVDVVQNGLFATNEDFYRETDTGLESTKEPINDFTDGIDSVADDIAEKLLECVGRNNIDGVLGDGIEHYQGYDWQAEAWKPIYKVFDKWLKNQPDIEDDEGEDVIKVVPIAEAPEDYDILLAVDAVNLDYHPILLRLNIPYKHCNTFLLALNRYLLDADIENRFTAERYGHLKSSFETIEYELNTNKEFAIKAGYDRDCRLCLWVHDGNINRLYYTNGTRKETSLNEVFYQLF